MKKLTYFAALTLFAALLILSLALPLVAHAGQPGNNGNGHGGCGMGQHTNGCGPGTTPPPSPPGTGTTNNGGAGGSGGAGGAGGQGGAGGTGVGIGIAGAAASSHASAKASASARQAQQQGQAQGQQQGQQQGQAIVGSGNSTNRVSSTGGSAKQSQSTASASNQSQTNAGNALAGGNNSTSVVYQAPERNPVGSAIAAPLTTSNGTCMGSTSAGGQGVTIGLSFGTTWTDSACSARYDADALRAAGQPKAAVARLCLTKEVAQAMRDAGTPCPTEAAQQHTASASGYTGTDPIVLARLARGGQ